MKKDTAALTLMEIQNRVKRLRPGDKVELPDKDGNLPYVATVLRIGKNIVQFKKENGITISLSFFEAMQANLIKPSGFEAYSNDNALGDFCNAINNKK